MPALTIVQDLLTSGMKGQVEAGDTIGLWTFNEELYTGRFPLQTWSPPAQEDIMRNAIAFLKAQKYERQAKLSTVFPALGRIINNSELITVIIISTGGDKIQGTPIDARINEFYQRWRGALQKAGMPVITVLRSRHGQLDDCVVNIPPWPLELPPIDSETKGTETAWATRANATPKTLSPAVPPLVISGKRLQPEQAPTPKPEPAVGKADAPPALKTAAVTNEIVKAKPPEPAAPPHEAPKTEPRASLGASASPNEAFEARRLEPAVPSVEVGEAEPSFTAAFATIPDEPAKAKAPEPVVPSVKTATAQPPPAKAETPAASRVPEPAPAPASVVQSRQEGPGAPQAKAVEPAPAKSEAASPPPVPPQAPKPSTIEPPKPSAPLQAAAGPTPAASPAPEHAPTVAANIAAAQPAPVAVPSTASPPSSLPNPRVQNAMAIPAGTITSHQYIWIVGLFLAGLAGVFAFVLARHSRATPEGSLITRSFERENKS